MNTPDEFASNSHTVVDRVDNNPESKDLSDPDHLPDGGLVAWLTTFGAFLIQIGGFGFINAFGVFQDYYSQQYLTNVSPSAISWIGSTNSFLVLSGGLFFGPLYDRGYFYWLVIGGCILQTLCLFMLSLTQQNHYYQVFLAHGLGFGLATSMSYVPSLAVISHHFHKRRDIAMSIVAGGTSFGAIIYTILLDNLLNGNLGFANSIRITAAANALLLLIGCTLMRTRPISNSNNMPHLSYIRVLKTSLNDHPYILASIGLFLFGAGSFFPIFYIQIDSSMHGLGQVFSFYTIVILNGGNFIGRATAGFITARCGVSNTVIASTLISGILTFPMMSLSTRAGAGCIAAFIGYFPGVYVALSAPLIALLTENLSELGARMGISLFMAGLGSLGGTPLAGALLGSNYVWWKPAVLSGCFSIASSATFLATEVVLRRRKRAVLASAQTLPSPP